MPGFSSDELPAHRCARLVTVSGDANARVPEVDEVIAFFHKALRESIPQRDQGALTADPHLRRWKWRVERQRAREM